MLPVMVADMPAGLRTRPAESITVLVGQKVAYVRLGHAICLVFSGGSQVLVETVARLDGPGVRADIQPDDHPSDAVASLLGDVVRTARISGTGELHLTFDSGSELSVHADADVESWAVAGPGQVLIVCLAGAELAVWGDPVP